MYMWGGQRLRWGPRFLIPETAFALREFEHARRVFVTEAFCPHSRVYRNKKRTVRSRLGVKPFSEKPRYRNLDQCRSRRRGPMLKAKPRFAAEQAFVLRSGRIVN